MNIENFVRVSKGFDSYYIDIKEISYIHKKHDPFGNIFFIIMKNGDKLKADEKMFVTALEQLEKKEKKL